MTDGISGFLFARGRRTNRPWPHTRIPSVNKYDRWYYLDWPGVAEVARLTRTREIGGKTSVATVYQNTSLTAPEASPERLLALNHAH